MNKKWLISAIMGLVITAANADEISTTADGQSDLHVTIYNSNVALIKDRRELTLPVGVNTLAFKDVSAKIQPETAILSADGVKLLEQNFEYDLLTPQSLLNKFVGKNVTLTHDENGTLVKESAKVLANNNGTVLKVGDQIRTLTEQDNIIFDDLPKDLRDRPTLTMLVDNQRAEKQPVSLSYLTQGLNWKADYVASLLDNKTLDLKGWVTLTNNSGSGYRNAKLQLVAGELNRAQAMPVDAGFMAKQARVEMAADANMSEESLFEYHLYSLERPTTIKNNQQKQVSLLEAVSVPYNKQLIINASDSYGWRRWGKDSEYQDLVTEAKIIIDNKKADNLGLPLPAGIVRTYQKDSRGNAQFIGEDRIKHTPENESITLKLGEAFDVTAKRKQTDFHSQRQAKQTAVSKVQHTTITAAYEIVFKNAKDSDVTVDYQERFSGNWTLKNQSIPSKKINSTLNRWKVKIPAKGETKLTYTVEMVH